eukprot:g3368.t1
MLTCKQRLVVSHGRRCNIKAINAKRIRDRACQTSKYSFETDYAKSLRLSSPDEFSTDIETGWLWELSAKTIKRKFDKEKIRPKKSLGQNFVTDEDVLQRIAHAINIQPGEPIIEFGPGTGNLTRYLLEAGADVTAIEKDDILQQRLKEKFENNDHLHIIHSDVMLMNFENLISIMQQRFPDNGRMKIVSNLPYNITTNCLKLYLPQGDCISDLMFMIQDEVAQRLCQTQPGESQYRAMTVYAKHFSDPKYLFKIRKGAYKPQPLVDGAFVDFSLKKSSERLNQAEESSFISFVNKAFSSKRKLLKNSMEPLYSGDLVHEALQSLDIPTNTRGQELSYEQFIAVYNALKLSG